jgi:hypothetical protein
MEGLMLFVVVIVLVVLGYTSHHLPDSELKP